MSALHCKVGVFANSRGEKQIRLVFPAWPLDGITVPMVSVHPHPCGTCAGGDHTHIEINDTREPVRWIREDACITLSLEHRTAINTVLRAKLIVDRLTQELAAYVEPFAALV